MKFLRTHAELIFFALFLVFITSVLGPSLDACDQRQDAARTAHASR